MKKAIILATTALALVITGGYVYSNHYNQSNVPVRVGNIEANHAIFANAVDAEAQSDAVVRVIATDDSKNVIENFNWGPTGRTETKVTVKKVYKGSSKKDIGSEIVVFEPSYVLEDSKGSTRINYEGYVPMVPGEEYILYLVYSDRLGGYWINALEQGKFNVTGNDKAEAKLQESDQQYDKLKKDVLEKYKD
ncbi:hypothetical protein [Paenibacillus durus]|uniref:Uncharacterized protein n=1 Tax=Paenibacillus durus TaxID=44251 RepID=A0A089HMJ8_PAEDU|nr:hypothetical protein [Paenibacillus durus]AIQ11608.1 hypothetical protein PDUR_06340 [Paenibacillus durus]